MKSDINNKTGSTNSVDEDVPTSTKDLDKWIVQETGDIITSIELRRATTT